jgi:hypothetical protein
MQIQLGDIDLIQRSKDYGERQQNLRTVLSLSTKDKRRIIELQIPGSQGNKLQEMGPEPLEINLEGEMYGSDASDAIQSLQKLFESGKLQKFSSNLSAFRDISKVSILGLDVTRTLGTEMHFSYSIQLKQSEEEL